MRWDRRNLRAVNEGQLKRDDDTVLRLTRRTLRQVIFVGLAVVVLAGVGIGAFLAGRSSSPPKTALATTTNKTTHPTRSSATTASSLPTTTTTALPSPTTTTAPPVIPQVADCGGPPGTKPTSLHWCTSECSSYMDDITWTTWGPDSAVGVGTWVTKTTNPRTGQTFIPCSESIPIPHPNSPIELSTPQYVIMCPTGGSPMTVLVFTHSNMSVGVTPDSNSCPQ